jgi:hypothetical protein
MIGAIVAGIMGFIFIVVLIVICIRCRKYGGIAV